MFSSRTQLPSAGDFALGENGEQRHILEGHARSITDCDSGRHVTCQGRTWEPWTVSKGTWLSPGGPGKVSQGEGHLSKSLSGSQPGEASIGLFSPFFFPRSPLQALEGPYLCTLEVG